MEAQLSEVIRPGAGRGLDFVILEELRKRTGITKDTVFKWSLSEMLCNSLDTDATSITIHAYEEGPFDVFTVQDNGTKIITAEDLNMILDFSNKASSKRGFLRVSRGYLGNALKCIFGYTHALAIQKHLNPPNIVVESHGTRYIIKLEANKIREEIEKEITVNKDDNINYNSFTIKLPQVRSPFSMMNGAAIDEANTILSLLKATSYVNPKRQIKYILWDIVEGFYGNPLVAEQLRNETSILWYTEKQFIELFYDFVKVTPETQLKDFISLFRGLSSKKKHREILQLIPTNNHDSGGSKGVQFLPSTPISKLDEKDIGFLLKSMRGFVKPISKRSIPKVLGAVGEERFTKIKDQNGWTNLKYVILKDHIESDQRTYPYLVEVSVFDRDPKDRLGVRVYQCVNFMASNEKMFSRLFDIEWRLGKVGIDENSPVSIIVHFVCPVLEWMNYAKTYIGGRHLGELLKKAFDKVLPIPKKPKVYIPKKPKKPVSWVPSGSLGNPTYEKRLVAFSKEIRAHDVRRSKSLVEKFSSRGWCYFFEGLNKISKGEFAKTQKAINDCRKVGYLPIDFTAEDQDITRRFSGIHEASDPTVALKDLKDDVIDLLKELPAYSTDYWENEEYYLMTCVEKGDIKNLFKRICREYHIPIVSSKGWAPILLRGHITELARRAEENGLKPVLLLFYDHDPAGLKITNLFRKNLWDIARATGWEPTNLIIDRFGLNEEDINKYELSWIEDLRTSSGKKSKDKDYIFHYGRKKCESNALFKNEETLKAGIEICRNAIEKYYGEDALDRFKEKEKESKKRLQKIYDNPIWENLPKTIDDIIKRFSTKNEEDKEELIPELEEIHEITVNQQYYARCPICGSSFDDTKVEMGQIFRCRYCNTALLLKEASP